MLNNIIFRLIFLSYFVFSCGQNFYTEFEAKNYAGRAATLLDYGKVEEAKQILLEGLGSDFSQRFQNINSSSNLREEQAALTEIINNIRVKNPALGVDNLVSILASAVAQSINVEPLFIGLKLAEEGMLDQSKANETAESDSASSDLITKLFPIMPEPSTENIFIIDLALLLLSCISEYSTTTDKFKQSLFNLSSIALVQKSLDGDGSGVLTLEEIENLSPEQALLIFNKLDNAEALSKLMSTGEGTDTDAAVGKIASVKEEIGSAEGDDQQEQIQNYLKQKRIYLSLSFLRERWS